MGVMTAFVTVSFTFDIACCPLRAATTASAREAVLLGILALRFVQSSAAFFSRGLPFLFFCFFCFFCLSLSSLILLFDNL